MSDLTKPLFGLCDDETMCIKWKLLKTYKFPSLCLIEYFNVTTSESATKCEFSYSLLNSYVCDTQMSIHYVERMLIIRHH